MSIPLIDELQEVCETIGDQRAYISEYESGHEHKDQKMHDRLQGLLVELGDIGGELDTQLNSIRLMLRKCQALVPPHRQDIIRDLKGAERWLKGETRKISVRGIE